MYEYYCSECNKLCDFDTEIELSEWGFGDYQEVHMTCNSMVEVRLKIN